MILYISRDGRGAHKFRDGTVMPGHIYGEGTYEHQTKLKNSLKFLKSRVKTSAK